MFRTARRSPAVVLAALLGQLLTTLPCGEMALATGGLAAVIDTMPLVCGGRGASAIVFDGQGNMVLNHTASSTGDVPEFSPSVQQGLGSVSKLAAAATFMAAVVDTGKGSLDAPIRETLPDVFAAGGAQGGDATPRMLLSHTSGFNDAVYDAGTDCYIRNPYHANHCRADEVNPTLSTCISQVVRLPMLAPPGLDFEYSNNAYFLIAAVVERLTGMTFEEALQRYVARPLGMNSTTYACPDSGSTVELPHVSNGLCSTAADYSKLVQMVLLGGVTPGGRRLLSIEAVHMMTTNQVGKARKKYACWMKLLSLQRTGAPNSAIPTTCFGHVDNSLPPFQDPLYGYGLGVFMISGFKFNALVHPGSQGWMWYIVPGQYAVTFAISNLGNGTLNAQTYTYFAAALKALEEDSFPQRGWCEHNHNLTYHDFDDVSSRFMFVQPPRCAPPWTAGQRLLHLGVGQAADALDARNESAAAQSQAGPSADETTEPVHHDDGGESHRDGKGSARLVGRAAAAARLFQAHNESAAAQSQAGPSADETTEPVHHDDGGESHRDGKSSARLVGRVAAAGRLFQARNESAAAQPAMSPPPSKPVARQLLQPEPIYRTSGTSAVIAHQLGVAFIVLVVLVVAARS
eukprot:jgi/Tetstr1/454724/TSEL_041610.t1